MEDASRGLAERTVRWLGWTGRVGALGGAYLLDGRPADAARIAQDGLGSARQRGERGVEGHVLRLLGAIAAHPDRFEADAAEAHYRHLGLGVLYRRAGTRKQARERLATAVTMFGEMDMLYWREQAAAELNHCPTASRRGEQEHEDDH
jgi:hypothetical protein